MDPGFAEGLRPLGMAYEKATYTEAIAEFQKSLDASNGNPLALGSLGHAQAAAEDVKNARRSLSDLVELSRRRYVSPLDIAIIETGLGHKERALEWLEKALDDRSLEMIFLTVDARFDSLHGDPRFANLLRRMGLSL